MNPYMVSFAIVALAATSISGIILLVAHVFKRWYDNTFPEIRTYSRRDPIRRQRRMWKNIERWGLMSTVFLSIIFLLIVCTIIIAPSN